MPDTFSLSYQLFKISHNISWWWTKVLRWTVLFCFADGFFQAHMHIDHSPCGSHYTTQLTRPRAARTHGTISCSNLNLHLHFLWYSLYCHLSLLHPQVQHTKVGNLGIHAVNLRCISDVMKMTVNFIKSLTSFCLSYLIIPCCCLILHYTFDWLC